MNKKSTNSCDLIRPEQRMSSGPGARASRAGKTDSTECSASSRSAAEKGAQSAEPESSSTSLSVSRERRSNAGSRMSRLINAGDLVCSNILVSNILACASALILSEAEAYSLPEPIMLNYTKLLIGKQAIRIPALRAAH